MLAKRLLPLAVVLTCGILLSSSPVFAQEIAGVVKDTSGAVLPGVTVEASSPALIEKVRTVVSDDSGEFKIVALRPGTYVVTFNLTGFGPVRRENIALTTGFTATVNATMTVGTLEETVTVTSESPLVDTHGVKRTDILKAEEVEVLPTGRTSTALAQLIPGISVTEGGAKFQDVGGLAGEGNSFVIHGSRFNEGAWLVNGMPYSNMSRSNSGTMRPDVGQAQEFALETSAISAEYREGGVAMNLVGKEGSNVFRGQLFGTFANDSLQWSNFDADLLARGIKETNRLKYNSDWSISAGGPIVQNTLWYFGTFRSFGTDNYLANNYVDANQRDFFYTPDLSQQTVWVERIKNGAGRVTYQMNQKNKLQFYYQQQPRTGFASTDLTLMPEGRAIRDTLNHGNVYSQLLYTAPLTSRLLVDAGLSVFLERTNAHAIDLPTDTPNFGYSIQDTSKGIIYNYPASEGPGRQIVTGYKAAVSYVTGSHTFKTGLTLETGTAGPTYTNTIRDMTLRFADGVPNRLTLQVNPRFTKAKLDGDLGIYATDQWTHKRLTLNLGLRYDQNHGSVPAQDQAAGTFLAARHYDEVKDVPNWKDLSPRLGAAYDLFGDGRTAIKGTWSRYVGGGNKVAIANLANPVATTVNNATRNWTDFSGDHIPQCDFLNPVANGECTGPISNTAFGTNVITTSLDKKITEGFAVRPYNTEWSTSVQHQMLPWLGINAGYYHRAYYNFTVNDNILLSPSDYDPFCITTPSDARLPGGGGQRLCGYYDVNPTNPNFNKSFTNITRAKNFGKQEDVYDGVDVSVNTRIGHGIVLGGGFSTGRERFNNCIVVDSPDYIGVGLNPATYLPLTSHLPSADNSFCDVRPPFQTIAKTLASFTLPWDIIIAGTFQTSPGPIITATYTAPASVIVPGPGGLGRPLSNGANGTLDLEIIPPGTEYGERVYQFDTRFSKVVKVGRLRFQGNFDLFNIFNVNPVLAQQNAYGTNGSAWLTPLNVMPGRVAKLGGQIDF